MKRRILVAVAALFVMTVYFPSVTEAQPGRGMGHPVFERHPGEKGQRRARQARNKVKNRDWRARERARIDARRDRYYGDYDRDPRYRDRRYPDRDDRYYNDDYYDDDYYDDDYYRRDRSVYDRHRNVINIGIGAGAGAVVGGVVGGKKGALIGAGVGAAAGAVYTYGINPKDDRKRRRYRR